MLNPAMCVMRRLTLDKDSSTRYAVILGRTSPNLTLLQYEFENQILFELGYGLTWR